LLIEELPDLEEVAESATSGVLDVSSIKLDEINETVPRNKPEKKVSEQVVATEVAAVTSDLITDSKSESKADLFTNFDKIKSDQFDSLD
jgi:hypothetical protein